MRLRAELKKAPDWTGPSSVLNLSLLELCWKQRPKDRPSSSTLKLETQDAYAKLRALAWREEEYLCIVCMEGRAEDVLIVCCC